MTNEDTDNSEGAGADFHGMVGSSQAMRQVYQRIDRFGRAELPVIISGESGTGKEMAARAIHRISGPEQPFIPLNCGAIPESLVESELFGYRRGAFTGAVRGQDGLVAAADGGILFLDELSELSASAQAKLLRVIETGEYRPLGTGRARHANFRVIAATNQDLDDLAREGRFRPDLLYRLGTARILMPPLRDRLEDLPALADSFLRARFPASPRRLTAPAQRLLCSRNWPGNVRELKNVVETAGVLAKGSMVDIAQLEAVLQEPDDRLDPGVVRVSNRDHTGGGGEGEFATLEEIVRDAEYRAIRRALIRTGGHRSRAADELGIGIATLHRKLRQLRKLRRLNSYTFLFYPTEVPDEFPES